MLSDLKFALRTLGVTRFLRVMLYGVSPFDPASFVAVALVLSAIAFVASYVPVRRAARVDPVQALRAGVSARFIERVLTASQ